MPLNPNPYTIYYLDLTNSPASITLDRNVLTFTKQGVYYNDSVTFFFLPIDRVQLISSDVGLELGI